MPHVSKTFSWLLLAVGNLTNKKTVPVGATTDSLSVSAVGSLLEFLKDGEGRGSKLPNLVDMAAQVHLDF